MEAVTTTVMSPKSMRVTWKPPKRKDWKGRIESYKLTLTRHNGNSGINKRAEAVSRDIVIQPMSNHPDPSLAKEPLENETHVIEGLEENFEYTLSIVVTNAVGDSISSAAAVTRMPQAGKFLFIYCYIDQMYSSNWASFEYNTTKCFTLCFEYHLATSRSIGCKWCHNWL